MPPAVIPVATAVAGAKIAGAAAVIGALGTTGAAIAGAVVAAGISTIAGRAFIKEPKQPGFTQEARGRSLIVRSSVEAHKVIYGRVRVSGTLVFVETTASADVKRTSSTIENSNHDNQFVHMVIALAGHEVEEIESVILDDITLTLDGDNYATNAEFTGTIDAKETYLVRAKLHTGTTTQAADTDLVSEVTNWTSNHRLREIAYIYVRLQYNADKFPNGIPQIRAIVKGKKVYDTRTSTTAYSDNWALCVHDYITSQYGLDADSTEIDTTTFDAAANTSEESVTIQPSGTHDRYTCNGVVDTSEKPIDILRALVSAGSGALTWSEGEFHLFAGAYDTPTVTIDEDWLRGPMRIQATAPRSDLFNAVRGTFVDENESWQPTDFAPVENAVYESEDSGVSEDFTADAGTDIMTITTGGWFATGSKVIVSTDGTLPNPLAASTDYYTIYQSDTTFKLATTRENAVDGTAINLTDTGSGTHTVLKCEQIFQDIELPFTTDEQRAQRIAKISLEKARQDIMVQMPCNLYALQFAVWDTVLVDNTALGWSGKVFRIMSMQFSRDGGIDLRMQEESSASYTWASGEASVLDAAPNTNLPDPTSVTAPASLTLASGTAQLDTRADGTIFSRIKASWTASTDIFVTQGGLFEIQYKKNADSEWEKGQFVDGDETFARILDVKDGVAYDVRVRAINYLGVKSSWSTVSNHSVVGKTAAPSDVSSLSVQQNANVVVFQWPGVTDTDLFGYIIKFGATGTAYANMDLLTKATKGTQITSAAVPPGSWTFGIKAVDTSGNESDTAATKNLTVTNTFDVIEQETNATLWLGTKTNMARNPRNGWLYPLDQDVPSGNEFNVFDNFVVNPYATYSYEAAEIDTGQDGNVRVWSQIDITTGPGEGVAAPIKQFDYRKDADSYDGFEDLIGIATVEAQHFKFKAVMNGTDELASYREYTNTVDQQERNESGSTVVAVSGTAISFTEAFFSAPKVTVTAQDSSGARIATFSSVTTTGFTATVYNASGTDVGGTVNWNAIGV